MAGTVQLAAAMLPTIVMEEVDDALAVQRARAFSNRTLITQTPKHDEYCQKLLE